MGVLVLVLALALLMLVLGGKSTRRRFAVACGAWLGATALLLLPLALVTSACDAPSLLWRPHVAKMCRMNRMSANGLTLYSTMSSLGGRHLGGTWVDEEGKMG